MSQEKKILEYFYLMLTENFSLMNKKKVLSKKTCVKLNGILSF